MISFSRFLMKYLKQWLILYTKCKFNWGKREREHYQDKENERKKREKKKTGTISVCAP